MEIGNLTDLSKYRYEKALSNIRIAKSLFEDKEFSAALNRAYYSAFDAMRAVNALDGFDSSKHSGVIAYFNQNYVKNSIFPSETSSIIKKASLLREKSDYEDFFEPDYDETFDIIKKVEVFLSVVGKYLEEKYRIKN